MSNNVPQVNTATASPEVELGPRKAEDIAKAMGCSIEEAQAIIDRCIRDPEGFAKMQRFIQEMRQASVQKRPVKGYSLKHTRKQVGRNDPCPCGCGKKFKKCETFKGQKYIGVIVHYANTPEETPKDGTTTATKSVDVPSH